MRISTKLIMLLVTAVLSVMAVYALVTISRTRDMLTEELRKMAEHISLALSVGALHHLERGDAQGVESVLETISRNPDVAGAAVFSRSGDLVAASRSMAPELQGGRQSYTNGEGKGWFEEEEGYRTYVYVTGIRGTDGQVIGSLRLALYERSMLPYALQSRNHILVTIAVLTAVLSALVIYVSQKQIAGPLKALTEGAEAFGQGELDRRIDIEEGGEVGALAAAFNRMAVNLEASNRELVSEREHIQGIVDSIPEGIFVIDRKRRITTWNQTMAQGYGRELEGVVGKRLADVLPGIDSDDFRRMVDCLLGGEMPKCEIREMKCKSLPGRVLSVIGSPLRDTGDRQGGAVLVMIDITDRIRLERQIQQSEKLAAIGQLAAGVAHEIGTPLNVISGSAEYLLMDVEGDDPRAEELRTIVSEVERITDLVKRLMAFARQGEPKVEPVGVAGLVESVLVLLRRQMEKQGIHIEVNLAPDLPDVVGDRDQLQQVLLNLVMNAWQAMPEGGTLTLAAQYGAEEGIGDRFLAEDEAPLQWITLAVEDTGAGISEDVIQKVFDPFFTTKEVGQGTGLGLSIVHRIVEDHGGHIALSSRAGEGSILKVFLPVDRGVGSHG